MTAPTAPVTWHGGKARLAPAIIAQFPPHKAYVEVFGGSGAVLLAKQRAPVETYNDIDAELHNLFTVLADRAAVVELAFKLGLTLYSRREFEQAKQPTRDPVERARRLIVRQRQSHGGLGDHWSYTREDSRCGVSSAAARWLAGLDDLPAVCERLRGVQIETCDWRVCIERYDAPETLFYLDPPYVPETRIRGGYRHELTEADHYALVGVLLQVRGMVVVSGYPHVIYAPLESAEWSRIDCNVLAHSSDTRTPRVECLWINPQVMAANIAAKCRHQLPLFERNA